MKLKRAVPTILYLCEINRLVLQVQRPYIFMMHPDCTACLAYSEGWRHEASNKCVHDRVDLPEAPCALCEEEERQPCLCDGVGCWRCE